MIWIVYITQTESEHANQGEGVQYGDNHKNSKQNLQTTQKCESKCLTAKSKVSRSTVAN